MATELKQVKQRLASTRQIAKVTRAMQNVAATRLVRDRRAAERITRYVDGLREVLGRLGASVSHPAHPLLAAPGRGRAALVAFGSDRGLCGGFNSLLVDEVQRFVAGRGADAVDVVVVGKVLARRLRRVGRRLHRFFPQPGRQPAAGGGDGLPALVGAVTDGFLAGTFREVHLLYFRFVTRLRQTAAIERLLPVPWPPAAPPAGRWDAFEPLPETILARVLPEFVGRSVEAALLHSVASEDAARQTAMSRASENANGIIRGLMVAYRRLRQESITTEMIEIAGGGGG